MEDLAPLLRARNCFRRGGERVYSCNSISSARGFSGTEKSGGSSTRRVPGAIYAVA